MNITQRQPHGYGGMLPANIHAIRILGFTHPQPLLSAVLTAAELSLLCWLGRPRGSGWLAWLVEDSWTVVHSLLFLTTKDRETLPAPIPQPPAPTGSWHQLPTNTQPLSGLWGRGGNGRSSISLLKHDNPPQWWIKGKSLMQGHQFSRLQIQLLSPLISIHPWVNLFSSVLQLKVKNACGEQLQTLIVGNRGKGSLKKNRGC